MGAESDLVPKTSNDTQDCDKAKSTIYQRTKTWSGFSALRGDSYSDVGYSTFRTRVPSPSAAQPLGIEFPGITYNEEGLPNWVGHLISKYRPAPRFDASVDTANQDPEYIRSPLLVYDYAIGGQTVEGVRSQVENIFLQSDLMSTVSEDAWNASNSIFITWIGINDCGSFVRSNTQTAIGNLFATQQKLYDVGARNFLFIDVPPIHRSPAIPKQEENESASYYQVWNTTLRTAIDEFSRNHDDASVFLFSSYEIFENVLDKPKDFGIKPKEVRKAGGQVWVDYLHPTSKVHDILASSLANFLGQI